MPHYVYIIFSSKLNKFYIGETAYPNERLEEHNKGKYAGSFTKQSSDWEIFLIIECEGREHALKVERRVKSMKSTKYIKNLKLYPELIEKLLTI